MKQSLVALMLGAVVLSVLAGCSGSGDTVKADDVKSWAKAEGETNAPDPNADR